MIFIAHRGNLNGPSSEENKPEYLKAAIDKGFNVEADLWLIGDDFYLGHDEPQYQIDFLDICKISQYTWCHCKNIAAMLHFAYRRNQVNSSIKFFWHGEDDIALTSNNLFWTFPGISLTKNSIAVMPERVDYLEEELFEAYGICTDYPIIYKEQYNERLRRHDGEG